MYIIKSNPNVETNGIVFQNCKIENSLLFLETDTNSFKYESGKWFIKSSLKNEWVYLGIGANPAYTVQYASSSTLFANVFEKVKNEEETS